MEEEKSNFLSKINQVYEKDYKKLLLIPFILLLLALIQIGVQSATTGDFLNKGVSLKGGLTLTVTEHSDADIDQIQQQLSSSFPRKDITVRRLTAGASQVGIIVEADVDANNKEEIDEFLNKVEGLLNLKKNDYTIELIGSSLGKSFFREAFFALLLAFLFMGVVVFLYFKTLAPSTAVILAAVSDIIVTLSIVNILGIKLSTAGIAAFLMLIGYSVDTDILLSTKVLKRKEGTVIDRIYGAMKTGSMMSLTTIVAVTIALIFSQSEVIKQIMVILLIGLLIDLINTWIQNVGILRLYLERKQRKAQQ